MRRVVGGFLVFVFLYAPAFLGAKAQQLPQLPPLVPGVLQNYYSQDPLEAIAVIRMLVSLRNLLLYAGIILVIAMLALAGIQMLMTRGEEKAVEQAKRTLKWTVIAALIIFGTYLIFSSIIALARFTII